jgi:hypothetical protein
LGEKYEEKKRKRKSGKMWENGKEMGKKKEEMGKKMRKKEAKE